ncbi:MAG: hypothetical protein A3A65_02690 [Candidatus Chisholmbacteria bacterium RIFCSPLOWO2_01_FULL_49_14]|uniref:Aspartyl/glutamyl-tRNA(Asn/Gln) amidotransferase subunit C n=1 Tax=Candidatus Chisholmbacteria bacterium RIFCSPLOWO2_01_FULL_49_14 TaxID=1797593 RepID=A0A1G1VZX1_9BACT|nr:MAG: hypothetical protein A3A65_02690 [Candidatus Chisholmbacteria bacterium RIFCSPLOWO2_01_FULL_49_14]
MKKKKRSISPKDVRHVAKLALLKLKEGEVKKFSKQLSDVFEYVNQIGEIRTSNVPETTQVTNSTNRFREDKIDKGHMLLQEEALKESKQTYNGYFVVKAIFGEDDAAS